MDLGIAGETALVLGGTRGLGFACAVALADAGVRVLVNGRDADAGRTAVERLGPGARYIPGDVAVPAERAALIRAARVEPVAILVNNAGGPPPGQFGDHGPEIWRQAVELSLLSAIEVTQALVPGMVERGFGRIVSITSFVVKEPLENMAISNALRVGLTGALATLAREVAGRGVTVNSLLPGLMDTGALQRVIDARARRENRGQDEVRRLMAQSVPMGRLGRAEDFGPLCAFLCSRLAGYITAQNIAVDGGLVRGLL
jgi:3-oxoacyl-[acyl-carrier protein] reductase